MTTLQVREAEMLWASGRTARFISDLLGMNESTLCSYMSNHRDRFPYRNAPLGPVDYGPLVRMWEEGATIRELARAAGMSDASMSKRVAAHRDLFPPRVGL